MSATLGTYLQALEPGWSMMMVERLDDVAQESSNGWNNAGTGHSALMELNYTPEQSDGSLNTTKAIAINESFQITRQFLAWQVKNGVMHQPHSFISSVPHVSFVWGEQNVNFMRKRVRALSQHPLFNGMEYSEDHAEISKWAPLVMNGRDADQKVAATRTIGGTDVNFGEVTRQLTDSLKRNSQFSLELNTEVQSLKRSGEGWRVSLRNAKGERRTVQARFVFIGAGGASLRLLQKSGIPAAKKYGGFPVGGQFLVTDNPEVVNQHLAKVYGKASVGAPPMSVPHLDTRLLDGKRVLLFGPFATFSTRFLKQGSLMDLLASVTPSNMVPMMKVGIDNLDLVKYLINQVMLSDEDRVEALREYYPEANPADWRLWTAGQRVQVIYNDPQKGGVLKLGTEVVADEEGTLAALLGASPGASTAAPIMLRLLETVFKEQVASEAWQQKLRAMIPSWGVALNDEPELAASIMQSTSEALQLDSQVPLNRPVATPEPEELESAAEVHQMADIAL
ncbi:putative malate:quinone oxidoreductase [Salmonella enterica subsp. enterica serovar Choleraesuis]|nr:putative malate:quinone oxidoreductase [Salmonella enterica subsp. enterica serovar Choleraesuis]